MCGGENHQRRDYSGKRRKDMVQTHDDPYFGDLCAELSVGFRRRHSGMRAKPVGPESIITTREALARPRYCS